jgi:hypothetical protein
MGPLDSALGNVSADRRSELNDDVQLLLAPLEQVRAVFQLEREIRNRPVVILTDYRVICLPVNDALRTYVSARIVSWSSIVACDISLETATVRLHLPKTAEYLGGSTVGKRSLKYAFSGDTQKWGRRFCQEFSRMHGSVEMKKVLSYSP